MPGGLQLKIGYMREDLPKIDHERIVGGLNRLVFAVEEHLEAWVTKC